MSGEANLPAFLKVRASAPIIRVGPGVHLALKHVVGEMKLPMGSAANHFILGAFIRGDMKNLSEFPKEIRTMMIADLYSSLGDLFKAIGAESIKNAPFAEIYKSMVRQAQGPVV